MSSDITNANDAKMEGNKAFSAGDYAGAITAYSLALRLDELNVKDGASSIKVTLLTNRAMAYWKIDKIEECERDCTAALAIEPIRIKSLYKRAQCYERLGNDSMALKDLHKICQLEPRNKEAVALAIKVKDKISSKVLSDTPISRALDVLVSEKSSKDEKIEALRAIGAICCEDSNASMEVLRKNGVSLIWSHTSDADSALAALRALSSCCQHKSFGILLMKLLLDNTAPFSIQDFGSVIMKSDQKDEIAVASIALLIHILQHDEFTVFSSHTIENTNTVLNSWQDLFAEIALVFAKSISSTSTSIRSAGIEGLARWCTEQSEIILEENRELAYKRKQLRSFMARDKGLISARIVTLPIYRLLDSEDANERRRSNFALSRIVKAVSGSMANDKEKELEKKSLQNVFLPYLRFGAESGYEKRESRLSGAIRRISIVTAISIADNEIGYWALSMDNCVAELMTLASSCITTAQDISAELICTAASFDTGRALLGPVVESGLIFTLMESPSSIARSAAASGYAKLGVISQAIKGDSNDIAKLLNVSLDLLGMDVPSNEKERAVEVLTFLVTKTKVKEELAHGSSRCKASLKRLCSVAQSIDGKSPMAYGLASIFAAISISREELQKEALKDKEISVDQYQQLQQIAESHGQGSKDDPLDADSIENANKRSAKFVENGGISALRSIAINASAATLLCIAKCYRHISCEQTTRGHIVQQGGLTFLINMSTDSEDEKISMECKHAIAKTLVTTNPNLITETQRLGCVKPLVSMCREHGATNLQQFEALLAIANLASTGHSVVTRIIDERGINALSYLMFNEHELVRRASTEAMLNLMPHPSVLKYMKSHDTARLWVAFSRIWEEDRPTAMAAIGGIAVSSGDEEVAAAFVEANVIDAFIEILQGSDAELIHRAASASTNFLSHPNTMDHFKTNDAFIQSLKNATKVANDRHPGKHALDEACSLLNQATKS